LIAEREQFRAVRRQGDGASVFMPQPRAAQASDRAARQRIAETITSGLGALALAGKDKRFPRQEHNETSHHQIGSMRTWHPHSPVIPVMRGLNRGRHVRSTPWGHKPLVEERPFGIRFFSSAWVPC
jgi:hypothetical protein